MTMLANIDTLEVSFNIKNYNINKYADDLDFKKSMALRSEDKVYLDFLGSKFYILGNGVRFYSYIIHNNDLEIRIARQRSKNLNNFPVYVRFKSKYLWQDGISSCIKYVRFLIEVYFGKILDEKVSRVDLCCHTDEFNFKTADVDRFLGKYRKDNIYRDNRKCNGFVFGTGATGIMCRIYDKVLEIKQSSDKQWFYDIWTDQNLFCDNVWNIEFEFTRNFLREIKINTLDDLVDSLGSLWSYATKEWIVFKDLTATRLERCLINKLWCKLQAVFSKFKSAGFVTRKKQIASTAKTYVPAIAGYISSFISCLDENLSFKTAFKTCVKECKDYYFSKNLDFETIVRDKRDLRLGLGLGVSCA